MSESKPVNASSTYEHELAIEQAHVDRVYRHLGQAAKDARSVAKESEARFTSDRDDWLREESGTALFERDAFAYQAAKRLAILDAEHEGLVFGRLDFSTDEETRYIGRLGVRDDDYEPLVIDWRAPAAEPFYRATAQKPMDVARRRVLRCRDDKVVGIEDDLLDANEDLVVVGEGALMAALKRTRGKKMRDIVTTIQAEQDEAIRAPYAGVTVISGGPGTGKTVVALHRAAFLLYTYRKRLQQGGVLMVGPTDIFMNYIERVLPGLGEDSVTLKSVGNLASDVLGFGSQRAGDAASALIKGSLRMLPVLRRAVHAPLSPDSMVLRVSVKGEILTLHPQELSEIRREVLSKTKVNQARPTAERALLDALWKSLSSDIAALLDLDRAVFDDIITAQASWQMFCNAWWPVITPEQVLTRLADPVFLHKVAREDLTEDEQHTLMESLKHARGFVPEPGNHHPKWSISDIALLDELANMIGPAPVVEEDDPTMFLTEAAQVNELVTLADRLTTQREIAENEPINTYSHVLVDESQDITPMQWRMLRRRGPHSSWTLVGDPAQSSYPEDTETRRVMREIVGRGEYRTFRLSKNYRSPKEVMEIAAKVISTVDDAAAIPQAVRSTGNEPVLLATRSSRLTRTLADSLVTMGSQTEGTLAVITPPGRFASIRDTIATMALPQEIGHRVSVVTALQSKGLEYDGVVVISPDEIIEQSQGGIRALYVALTRPTQRLTTIDITSNGAPGEWRDMLD